MASESTMTEALRIGDLIRHGRTSQGMTQAELAHFLAQRSSVFTGVDTVTISRWEASRVYPSTKRLIAFAKILYPQHTRTTLKHMIKDRPRGSQACPISKVNTYTHHPYLIGEENRALICSTSIDRLISGASRCVDPFYQALQNAESSDNRDHDFKLMVTDPSTDEVFGHLVASTIQLAHPEQSNYRGIIISSMYAGSNTIFEFLFSQFFRFAVQQDVDAFYFIACDQQQRSFAKRLGMTGARLSLPQDVEFFIKYRDAEVFVGSYYDVLAHPDFSGLFASDIPGYPMQQEEEARAERQSEEAAKTG